MLFFIIKNVEVFFSSNTSFHHRLVMEVLQHNRELDKESPKSVFRYSVSSGPKGLVVRVVSCRGTENERKKNTFDKKEK